MASPGSELRITSTPRPPVRCTHLVGEGQRTRVHDGLDPERPEVIALLRGAGGGEDLGPGAAGQLRWPRARRRRTRNGSGRVSPASEPGRGDSRAYDAVRKAMGSVAASVEAESAAAWAATSSARVDDMAAEGEAGDRQHLVADRGASDAVADGRDRGRCTRPPAARARRAGRDRCPAPSSRSLKLRPAATTSISTSPGPGDCRRSVSSARPPAYRAAAPPGGTARRPDDARPAGQARRGQVAVDVPLGPAPGRPRPRRPRPGSPRTATVHRRLRPGVEVHQLAAEPGVFAGDDPPQTDHWTLGDRQRFRPIADRLRPAVTR